MNVKKFTLVSAALAVLLMADTANANVIDNCWVNHHNNACVDILPINEPCILCDCTKLPVVDPIDSPVVY